MILFKKSKAKKEQKKAQDRKQQLDEVKEMMNDVMNRNLTVEQDSELNDVYLFDFKAGWQSGFNSSSGLMPLPLGSDMDREGSSEKDGQKIKVKIKPIDVLNELERTPKSFDLNLLDQKISILKDKADLINQDHALREIEALTSRLENRKKYAEFKLYFDQFDNTNDAKIERLLEKYDLVMKTSDIFIPEFPDEAIGIMKNYTKKTMELCNLKPVFYVIAEPDKFRKADDKRDPILLVQSPFGFYWQILGAWDKEMIILNEL